MTWSATSRAANDVDWVNSRLTARPTKCLTEAVHVSDGHDIMLDQRAERAAILDTLA
jgi:hypothetical protein